MTSSGEIVKCEGHSQWSESCEAIQFLNRSTFATSEKTVLVFGCGRGGTSAVSGALRILGVDMPHAHPLKHEWSPVCYVGEQVDRAATSRNIRSLNLKFRIWGWKAPKDVFCLNQYLSMLRNPHIIIVFRNILDVLKSSYKHEDIDFTASAIDVSNVYSELCHLINFTNLPVALINYEKLCANPLGPFTKIAYWLNLCCSNEMLEKGSKFTQVAKGEYREIDNNISESSFDPRELAIDQAKAQIAIYGKRAAEFLAYHSALLDDLRMAYEIKDHLNRALTEMHHCIPFEEQPMDIEGEDKSDDNNTLTTDAQPMDIEGEDKSDDNNTLTTDAQPMDIEGEDKSDDNNTLTTDAQLDELRRCARAAESAYQENRTKYFAALRDRIAIQTVIDNLAKEVADRKVGLST
jgi:hypothetical protein